MRGVDIRELSFSWNDSFNLQKNIMRVAGRQVEDLNQALTPGFYETANAKNYPTDSSDWAGALLKVYQRGSAIIQEIMGSIHGGFATRISLNKTSWYPWVIIHSPQTT